MGRDDGGEISECSTSREEVAIGREDLSQVIRKELGGKGSVPAKEELSRGPKKETRAPRPVSAGSLGFVQAGKGQRKRKSS